MDVAIIEPMKTFFLPNFLLNEGVIIAATILISIKATK